MCAVRRVSAVHMLFAVELNYNFICIAFKNGNNNKIELRFNLSFIHIKESARLEINRMIICL